MAGAGATGRAEFDQASAQTFLWEGMRVSEDRRAFRDLLLELAARLDICARKRTGVSRLRCLANHATVDPTTAIGWFKHQRKPEMDKLAKIAAATEVPLPRLLVALGWISWADLAAALEQELPKELLTADEQRWLSLGRSFSPARRRIYHDLLRRLEAADAGPDQRPADTSP